MRWTRRLRLPPTVRAALNLAPGERVLSVARTADQAWVIATERAVLSDGRRLEWTEVAHAEWDDGTSTLTIEAMPSAQPASQPSAQPSSQPSSQSSAQPDFTAASLPPQPLPRCRPDAHCARWRLVLERPELVPETVRERVTSSVAGSRHVRLAGRGGVRVIARRVAGSADLLWQVAPDYGTDPDDPGVAAATRHALAELRVELGG